MTNKQRLLLAAAVTTALTAGAVPAKRDIQVVTQPDGSSLQIKRVGDEHSHFVLTADDCVLTQGQDGAYYFGRLESTGEVINTGVIATDLNVRSTQAKAVAQTLDSELVATAVKARSSKRAMRRTLPQSGLGLFTGNFPSKGDIKALVILVQYSDVSFTTSNAKEYFSNLLNEEGFSKDGGTGSARDYFLDSSDNQFRPQFDVYGPVTLSNKRSYYGGNDYQGNDKNPEKMIIEGCKLLDSQINFADYDMDGDGKVDNVYVFYAGQGEASYGSSDTVWPHSWDLSDGNLSFKLDGVTIDRYACSNEYEQSKPDGIGTFVHEFSHVMGLPDLYDTAYANAIYITPSSWNVLDYGPYNNDSRTPPYYSAFERNAMGWTEPEILTSGSHSLEQIGASNKCYIVQTDDTNEFFLFENRQQTGWDKYIPGHGMLIWHITFNQSIWDSNIVNNSKSIQYVDIVEANGTANTKVSSQTALDKILDGYSWPGTSKKTEFSATTTPAFKTSGGTAMEGIFSNIAESNGVITFTYGGVVDPLETPVASATEIGSDYFVASWNAVPDATDYLVTVKAQLGGKPAVTETADMGSSTTLALPDGWTSSTTTIYTSSGNYGNASPSLKLGSNNAYLMTPEFEDDITAFSMWYKGMSTNESSKFTVSGLVDNAWVTITSVSPSSNVASSLSLTSEIPTGTKQIKVVYTKSQGNLAIDDVVVTTGGDGSSQVLADYNGVSTNGATSIRVDKLLEGQKEYTFTVKAISEDNSSNDSEAILVTLSDESGVSNIAVDATSGDAVYYNLNGVKVSRANLTSGVYVKVLNGKATKVVVK